MKKMWEIEKIMQKAQKSQNETKSEITLLAVIMGKNDCKLSISE
jgi:hypothetical protein